MIKKTAGLIAFGIGVYLGYQYVLDFLESYSGDFVGYWGETGAQAIRILTPLGIGILSGLAVYFILNLYARADD